MNSVLAIWRLLDARRRRQALWLQSLALIVAFSTLGGIASLAPFLMAVADPALVDRFAILASLRTALGFESARGFVVALGVGFVLVVMLSNIISMVSTLAMSRFALRVGDEFHALLLDEYLHRDYAFHARVGHVSLFNNVIFAVNRVAGGILESGMTCITQSIVIAAIVASVFVVNPAVALGALLWLGGTYAALYTFARRRLLRNGVREAELLAARARIASECFGGIKEILLLRRQPYFRAAFAGACSSLSSLTLHTQAVAQMPRYALESVTVIGLVGAALFLRGSGDFAEWIAQLTFFGFAAYRLLPAVQQLFVALVRIRANRGLFDDVAADLAQAVRRKAAPRAAVEPALVPRAAIALEHASFQYQAEARSALHDVSLRIPRGAVVGFAGPNGSGKSTLVDLLMALLPPTSGSLRIDGTLIDSTNREAWQRSLAYVPQTVFLLNASLAENIAFGEAATRIDRERLAAAIRQSGLNDLVARLPRGEDEIIGAGGRAVSGGERQRIGIARALYRDAPVLVMDEATSALDGSAEQDLVAVLRGLRGARTVLLIAHRVASLRECDVIFELEAGRLVHSGTFDELFARSDTFRAHAGAQLSVAAGATSRS